MSTAQAKRIATQIIGLTDDAAVKAINAHRIKYGYEVCEGRPTPLRSVNSIAGVLVLHTDEHNIVTRAYVGTRAHDRGDAP
jgi:hypothetical protein